MAKTKKTPQLTLKTTIEVLKRSKGRCEACGLFGDFPLHHINAKSKYFGKDKDLSWNLCNICFNCHRIIHHAGTDREIAIKRQIDYKLKEQALSRYHGDRRKELEMILNQAKIKTK